MDEITHVTITPCADSKYIKPLRIYYRQENDIGRIDTDKYPGKIGLTYELCAGIVDKDSGPDIIAQGEVLEECGYTIPLDALERVTSYRSGVGPKGALQIFYYAEVTDKMKVGHGGGMAKEGKMIAIIEVPQSEGDKFVMDESINKTMGMIFAIYWSYVDQYKLYDQNS